MAKYWKLIIHEKEIKPFVNLRQKKAVPPPPPPKKKKENKILRKVIYGIAETK